MKVLALIFSLFLFSSPALAKFGERGWILFQCSPEMGAPSEIGRWKALDLPLESKLWDSYTKGKVKVIQMVDFYTRFYTFADKQLGRKKPTYSREEIIDIFDRVEQECILPMYRSVEAQKRPKVVPPDPILEPQG